jgi:hypothetical protein
MSSNHFSMAALKPCIEPVIICQASSFLAS